MNFRAIMRRIKWSELPWRLMSVISVVTSVTVANLTVFKQVDELKMGLRSSPTLAPQKERLDLLGPMSITFVNSGKRAVAITNLTLWIIQPPKDPKIPECGYGRSALAVPAGYDIGDYFTSAALPKQKQLSDKELALFRYDLDVKPFSIGPGEMIFKDFRISSEGSREGEEKNIRLTRLNSFQKGVAGICLQVGITSADGNFVSNLALTTEQWDYDQAGATSGTIAYASSNGPVTILQVQHSLLFEDINAFYLPMKQLLNRMLERVSEMPNSGRGPLS